MSGRGEAAAAGPKWAARTSNEGMKLRRPWPSRALFALLAFVLAIAVVPHRVCAREAERVFAGEGEEVPRLANGVAAWVAERPAPGTFGTGSARFDGEWRFGTYAMAALGFGQRAAVTEGEARRAELTRMAASLEAMLEPDVRRFDTDAHGEDALGTLDRVGRGHGHLAFLAYAGLPLALEARLDPSSPRAPLARAVARTLAARFSADPRGIVETYPGEAYPVDMAMAVAAMAVSGREGEGPTRALARVRASVDPASGLLVQAVSVETGERRDAPRASGTALAAYALLYADRATSAALWGALRSEQLRTVVGFGAMLEYPAGARGAGDVDSGPVAFGLSVSATGFALAASRAHGDAEAFARLYATAHLFGAPWDEGAVRSYATGGPLGDAILFAMLTAPRAEGT